MNQEFLRNLADFLIVQKDVIDKIFSRMDNQQVAYSAALQLSLMKYLHNFVRRMSQEGRPINPKAVTRESLLTEQDYMVDLKLYSSDTKVSDVEKFTKDTKWHQFKDFLKKPPG